LTFLPLMRSLPPSPPPPNPNRYVLWVPCAVVYHGTLTFSVFLSHTHSNTHTHTHADTHTHNTHTRARQPGDSRGCKRCCQSHHGAVVPCGSEVGLAYLAQGPPGSVVANEGSGDPAHGVHGIILFCCYYYYYYYYFFFFFLIIIILLLLLLLLLLFFFLNFYPLRCTVLRASWCRAFR
jgi:hypothetical protein